MDELEMKVRDALIGVSQDDPRGGWDAMARAAIAAYREHCGGGYEAAARECERLAQHELEQAQKWRAMGDEKQLSCENCMGAHYAFLSAARIIREHEQHVPVVDREGLPDGLAEEFAFWFNRAQPPEEERETSVLSADDMPAVRVALGAILAHLGAQPAAVPAPYAPGDVLRGPAALYVVSRAEGERFWVLTRDSEIADCPELRAEARKLTPAEVRDAIYAAKDAAVPASEPAPAASFVERLDATKARAQQHPGSDGAVSSRAPAASEPAAVTSRSANTAMLRAALAPSEPVSADMMDAVNDYVVACGGTPGVHAAYDGGRRDRAVAGLRAALAAAPQRVREVGEAEAREVTATLERMGFAVDGGDWLRVCDALRAAGLCVAVPDGEWAALVAERDGERSLTKAAWRARDEFIAERDQLREQLAAATKRAEEAEREVGEWAEHLGQGAAFEVVADAQTLRTGESWAQAVARAIVQQDKALTEKHAKLVEVADKLRAAEARARELEKRAEEAEATRKAHTLLANDALARVRELEAALEMATRMSSEDLAEVQAANSDLRKRVERLTHQLADETGARDLRIRELEAAAREADTDYQRVAEERDRAEARLGQMAARPAVVDAGTQFSAGDRVRVKGAPAGLSEPVYDCTGTVEKVTLHEAWVKCDADGDGWFFSHDQLTRAQPAPVRDEGARKALEEVAKHFDDDVRGRHWLGEKWTSDVGNAIRAALNGEG